VRADAHGRNSAWAILEYFKKNWLEPAWLGCTLERYEQIKSHDDFLAWLDESPAHANSDLGFYWKMGLDIGLDKYGAGVGKYVSWGYLPHEDKYQKPTIDGRNAAVIMKSGVYDSVDRHPRADGPEASARELSHAGTTKGTADHHPFDRVTAPIQNNDIDHGGKYSWSTAVRHSEAVAWRRALRAPMVAGGKHGESWQHHDRCARHVQEDGRASVHLRQIARMHETIKLYRQAERCLREFKLNDPWYIKPRNGRPRLGRHRGDSRRAVPLDRGQGRQDQELPDHRADHLERGPATATGVRGPIEEALIGAPIADSQRPGGGRSRGAFVRLMPGLHGARARRQDRG
jgi:hydrogenase large subunit